MSEAHASAHYGGGVQAAHSFTPPDDSENLGFGTDLQCGTESSPDGDNDTDDIGTYPSLASAKNDYT
jgi:hypothetical protein